MSEVRVATPEELKEWRKDLPKGKKRGVWTESTPSSPKSEGFSSDGDEGSFVTEAPKPALPGAAAAAGEALVLDSFMRDRDQFAQLVRMIRFSHPKETAHMTDGEIGEFAKTVYREKVRDATTRAYHLLGREKELQIKTGGY